MRVDAPFVVASQSTSSAMRANARINAKLNAVRVHARARRTRASSRATTRANGSRFPSTTSSAHEGADDDDDGDDEGRRRRRRTGERVRELREKARRQVSEDVARERLDVNANANARARDERDEHVVSAMADGKSIDLNDGKAQRYKMNDVEGRVRAMEKAFERARDASEARAKDVERESEEKVARANERARASEREREEANAKAREFEAYAKTVEHRAKEERELERETSAREVEEERARTRAAKESAKEANDAVDRAKREIEDVRRALERALEAQGEVERRLDAEAKRAEDAKGDAERLERDLDDARRALTSATRDKESVEKRMEDAASEMATLRDEKVEVEVRLAETSERVVATGEIVEAMKRELNEARASLSKAQNENAAMERRVVEFNRELATLKDEKSTLELRLVEVSARVDSAAEVNAALLDELEHAKEISSASSELLEAVKLELEGAVKGRAAALEDSERLAAMLQSAKRDVAESKAESERLRDELANFQRESVAKGDVELFQQLAKAQQTEIEELHAIVSKLTLQTQALILESESPRDSRSQTKTAEASSSASSKVTIPKKSAASTQAPVEVEIVVEDSDRGDQIEVQVKAYVHKVRSEVEGHLRLALEAEAVDFVNAQEAAKKFASLNSSRYRDGVYYFVGEAKAGQKGRVLYNRHTQSAMSRDGQSFIHVGFDNWMGGESKKFGMTPLPHDSHDRNVDHRVRDTGDWWVAEFPIPDGVGTIDFVFSDANGKYDNNANQDYHCGVSDNASRAEKVTARIAAQRKAKQATIEKSIMRAGQRAAKLMRSRLEALAQAEAASTLNRVYTKPYQPQAGGEVMIYYRAEGGPLAQSPSIFCQGSWNRWNHPYDFGPLLMEPSDIPGTLQLSLHVPSDAHVMDFVFTNRDVPGAGAYDSNDRADYHATVIGGTGEPPKLHIVHIAVEMAPIAKVGGMGDVVTALARATMEDGHDVTVIVPKYDCMESGAVDGMHRIGTVKHENVDVDVYKGWVEDVPTTFLHPRNGFFDVGCIYGRRDDHVRFGFFSAAALTWMRSCNQQVDIIHAHDWQTAPVVWGNYPKAVTALTLHNLQFGVDLIKRGMDACDIATTVSPTYANEVREHGAIQSAHRKFVGIRNGIDTDIWDPSVDEFLPIMYDASNVTAGKKAAVRELAKRLNLNHPEGAPVVGVVSRLTAQKGIHLIKHACYKALERGATFVLLGSAPDGGHQNEFNMLAQDMAKKYPGRSGFMFKYDEAFSHMMYAGCDFLLVPSMFEPCGLTQMIAMRYGAVPVVRSTGGLRDTVFDVDNDVDRASAAGVAPNGFAFGGTQPPDMDYALNRALDAFYDKRRWSSLALPERVMNQDWSWREPAKLYVDRYWRAVKKKREST